MSQTKVYHQDRMERAHDYLYDPNFHVSSERDHARVTFKSHTSTDRVKKLPVFPTMFSDLRHYPRYTLRLDVTDPVPKFVNRQWRGVAEQQREAMIRYSKFNYDPSVTIPHKQFGTSDVGGQERYKYFRRPILPFGVNFRPDLVLSDAQDEFFRPHSGVADEKAGAGTFRADTPPFRDQEVQTMYRENEAQTDPYSPEYIVRPGSAPEILTLAGLVWGNGLPVGLSEVEMIERARAKRAWEKTLPELHDTDKLLQRQRMMEEQELKEWALREQEISDLQAKRLELLKELLIEREKNQREVNIKKLDRLWTKRQEKNQLRIRAIRKHHIKELRKITRRRENPEGKLYRRNLIKEYSDYKSQVYAPLTRIGYFLDNHSEIFNINTSIFNNYQALLDFENSLPACVRNPCIRAPKAPVKQYGKYVKRKFQREMELEDVHNTLKENRLKVPEPEAPLRFLAKIEPPPPRPETPSIAFPDIPQEEKDVELIFLQRILRGRSLQNMMYEGKSKRLELIGELRTTHSLKDFEMAAIQKNKMATLAMQRQRNLHEEREAAVAETLGEMEGTTLNRLLDFFTKELRRLQEERRMHAFCMLAERQRRVREAEEAGSRQAQIRRRREMDEIFKETIKVHQDTIESYLEDIIIDSVDNVADQDARKEVQEMAKKVNDAAYQAELTRQSEDTQDIVAELVFQFLIPEAGRAMLKEKIKTKQHKMLQAAHTSVFKTTEHNVLREVPSRRLNTSANVTRAPSKMQDKTSGADTGEVSQSSDNSQGSENLPDSEKSQDPEKSAK